MDIVKFKHDLFPFKDIDTETINDKRYYVVADDKKYMSVTTLLSNLSASSIKKWKQRVGQEVADKISQQATARGEDLHSICETYIRNEFEPKKVIPTKLMRFESVKRKLDAYLGTIKGIECPLYSDKMRLAGRSDCVGEWNGKMSIIDFKTSARYKKEQHVQNYFMQATCYSLMMKEMFDLNVDQIVILIVNDAQLDTQMFVRNPKDYVSPLMECIEKYHPEYSDIRSGLG